MHVDYHQHRFNGASPESVKSGRLHKFIVFDRTRRINGSVEDVRERIVHIFGAYLNHKERVAAFHVSREELKGAGDFVAEEEKHRVRAQFRSLSLSELEGFLKGDEQPQDPEEAAHLLREVQRAIAQDIWQDNGQSDATEADVPMTA